MTAYRRDNPDIRNEISTNVMVCIIDRGSNTWKILPTTTDNEYHIVVASDEANYDGSDQTGWYLSSHRWYE